MFKIAKFEPKPLRWWVSQHDKIDMNPPYQRQGRLWSIADKAFLIDSILNDYDIPKIYMADFTFGNVTLNKKSLSYSIIDGKQRFEAIHDFFTGVLRLDEQFIFQQDLSLKLGGLGYPDLSKNYPEVADIFNNYPLSVVHVITDDEEKINELFVRLNRSKPLTGAEVRNAVSGPFSDIVRLLVKHELFKSCVTFPTTRAQDKNAAAKILLFEYSGKPAETKRRNLDHFATSSRKESKEKFELASRRVVDSLDRMSEIFLPRDPLLRSAGVFPVCYWLIREGNSTDDRYIREFLYEFEKKRKESRGDADDAEPDSELAIFDRWNRSPDDEKSYVERFKILTRRFRAFQNKTK
jgi:hypothetical protein